MQEFSPYAHFVKFLRLWWVLLVAAILGGLAGYIYSRSHPPIYQAIATYGVSVDLNKVPQKPLELYDEDIALSSTQAALISPEVINDVIAQAAKLGRQMDTTQLLATSSIERQNAFWVLRFNDQDPAFAQTIVNIWATRGYQAMLDRQSQGLAPPYVLYSSPTLSGKVSTPIYFTTNKLVLAGSLAGWLIGLLLVELVVGRPALETSS